MANPVYTSKTFTAQYPSFFVSNDKTCAKEWLTTRNSGATATWKIPRESRVKPDDLLRNMTARANQSHERTQYLVYKRVLNTNVVCGGKTLAGKTTSHETTAVRRVVLDYPSIDWAQALRLKIMNLQYSFAETIGEWRESVKYLEGGADVLTRAYKGARNIWSSRRKRRTTVRFLKTLLPDYRHKELKTKQGFLDVASVHLAITYGITPMIGVIEDTLEQLNDKIGQLALRVQVTVPTEITARSSDALGPYYGTGKRSKRAIAYIWLQPEYANFTPGNLAEAIWAGTKLSFMVDWFLNVGSYLKALNSLDYIRELRGTVTTLTIADYTDEAAHQQGLVKKGKISQRMFSREIMTSIPMPSRVNYSLPSGDGVMNQLVSAVEILFQLRSGANR